jgi:hypothetical protein
MERRLNRRSKRRIPCEFQHEGHRYRGIAVNVSRSGLFIQTNASLSPGVELEVDFLGEYLGHVSLRGVVARRRAPPATLASVIRPGLGLRILEAPDAYFEVLGDEYLAASRSPSKAEPPKQHSETEIPASDDSGRETPTEASSTSAPGLSRSALERSAEAAWAATVLSVAENGEPEPAAPGASESAAKEPAPDGSELAEDEKTWAPETLYRSEALLIDNGELDDVFAMLEALGADPLRHQAVGVEGFSDWEKPPRIVVVSARAAARLTVVSRASESGIVTIAVAEADSQTLYRMLRRQGFDYVVRRPVHPEALRLLLMRALFRGSEQRSEPRLAFGSEVTARWGIRRHPATLLEISSGGCSFLGQEAPKPGTRISVRIPSGVAGKRKLTLRGRVRRSERRRGAAPEASTLVALVFDPLPRRTRECLERLLAAFVTGPPALSRATEQTSPDAKEPAPETGTDDLTEATGKVPRQHPRAAFGHEVVVLDEQLQRARHVLFARDLSVGGVRVDPHPDLQVGDHVKLALYDDASSDSVVVDAEVLRNEGDAGLALRFPNMPDRTARKIERIMERAGEIEQCDGQGDAHQVIVTEVLQEERA